MNKHTNSGSWRRDASEIRQGLWSGPPRILAAVSLLLFFITGIFWLVQHLTSWPGGYLPWMLSLAFLLLGISALLAFNEMRVQRDVAREEIQERFDTLRYRIKIGINGRPATGQYSDQEPQEGYSFFAIVANGSLEVMQYEVQSFDITMSDGSSVPPDSKISSTGGLILPGNSENYYLPFIPGPNNPLQFGEGEIVVNYWHPSQPQGLKFRARHKFEIGWDILPGQLPQARWTTVGDIVHSIVTDQAEGDSKSVMTNASPQLQTGE